MCVLRLLFVVPLYSQCGHGNFSVLCFSIILCFITFIHQIIYYDYKSLLLYQNEMIWMNSREQLHSMGLFPYYIISYNKQGSFQMITKDYSKGPRVVRKDYVLWKVQNMQESVSMPSPSGQSQFPIRSLWLWNSNQINLFVDNPYCL